MRQKKHRSRFWPLILLFNFMETSFLSSKKKKMTHQNDELRVALQSGMDTLGGVDDMCRNGFTRSKNINNKLYTQSCSFI